MMATRNGNSNTSPRSAPRPRRHQPQDLLRHQLPLPRLQDPHRNLPTHNDQRAVPETIRRPVTLAATKYSQRYLEFPLCSNIPFYGHSWDPKHLPWDLGTIARQELAVLLWLELFDRNHHRVSAFSGCEHRRRNWLTDFRHLVPKIPLHIGIHRARGQQHRGDSARYKFEGEFPHSHVQRRFAHRVVIDGWVARGGNLIHRGE